MPLPPDISRCINKLARNVRQGMLRQTTIAQATGVDQSQVSRILSGRIKRVSRNVLKLCNYANKLEVHISIDDDRFEEELLELTKRICLNDHERVDALKRLLLAVEQLQTVPGEKHAE